MTDEWLMNDSLILMFRRIHDGQTEGVWIIGAGTRGRLERCDVAGNKDAGVWMGGQADPTLSSCM